MPRTDKMKFGTFVYTFGYNPAGWLHPASDARGANDFSHMHRIAATSEAAKFDFMFLADSPAAAVGDPDALARSPTKMNRFEPLTLLVGARGHDPKGSGSSRRRRPAITSHSTSLVIFASIDHLSGGRACLERRDLGPRRNRVQF